MAPIGEQVILRQHFPGGRGPEASSEVGHRPGSPPLSHFWPADFALSGRSYRTVEHAFQAAKIAFVDPAAASRFALDSGNELARGDGAAARKHRKLVLLNDAQLRRWDEHKGAVMRDAMRAKFSHHESLRAVLVATLPAELWPGHGANPIRPRLRPGGNPRRIARLKRRMMGPPTRPAQIAAVVQCVDLLGNSEGCERSRR